MPHPFRLPPRPHLPGAEAHCKLIPLDGTSIFVAFKLQEAPQTLAAGAERTHCRRDTEADAYRHSLKIVSQIFGLKCQTRLQGRRLAGTAIDRCLICLARIS